MGCDRYIYNIGNPPAITYEHTWAFHTASGWYGPVQGSCWANSKGEILAGDDNWKRQGSHKTFTSIWFGNHNLTLPVNIWVTSALCLTALVLGFWLLIAAANGMMRKKQTEPRQ